MKLNFIQRTADRRDSFGLLITPKIFICGGNAAFFVFSATCAAENIANKRKRLFSVFKGNWGGIGGDRLCSPKIRDFRATAFPSKSVSTFSTHSIGA